MPVHAVCLKCTLLAVYSSCRGHFVVCCSILFVCTNISTRTRARTRTRTCNVTRRYYLKNNSSVGRGGHQGEIQLTANCGVVVSTWTGGQLVHHTHTQHTHTHTSERIDDRVVFIHPVEKGQILPQIFVCLCIRVAGSEVYIYAISIWDPVPHTVSKNNFQLVRHAIDHLVRPCSLLHEYVCGWISCLPCSHFKNNIFLTCAPRVGEIQKVIRQLTNERDGTTSS